LTKGGPKEATENVAGDYFIQHVRFFEAYPRLNRERVDTSVPTPVFTVTT